MNARVDIMSARTLAAAFHAGDDDPVAVATRCLAKADASPHCFITITRERALAEAAASRDRWRKGAPLGPLDGVPIAWKDMFDVRGTPTTMGSEIHRHALPAPRDAALVAKAAAAGMVTIGKTNLSEFAFSVLGLNPHFGTPSAASAGATIRVPGGSSSGSAVAVAEGAAPYGIATDTAGSARVPAAFNGLVGYRASSGRYPKMGLKALSSTLDTIGIIAGSVGDVAGLDDVFTGASHARASAAETPALVIDPYVLADDRVATSVREEVFAAIDTLQNAGFPVYRLRVTVMHEVVDAIARHGWLGAAEAFALHRDLLDSPDAAHMDARVRTRLLAAASITNEDVEALRHARSALMAQSSRELCDIIYVSPTVAHPPPEMADMEADPERFAEVNLATLRLTAPGSFLDLPTVSVPIGAGLDGCWTGLQLSVPTGEDERLLRDAARIEAALAPAAGARVA